MRKKTTDKELDKRMYKIQERGLMEVIRTNTNGPEEQIIQSVRKGIADGTLRPGTYLPAERKLVEMFGVGRVHVRQALRRLETYGIISIKPQSGSLILGVDSHALDGLLADILKLDSYDFASLAEMRVILEVNAARYCAERHTEKDMQDIRKALDHYNTLYLSPDTDADTRSGADFDLHRAIAKGTHNTVLHTMLMLITPDIMRIYRTQKICHTDDQQPYEEHNAIVESIEQGDAERAAELMHKHLNGVLQYARAARLAVEQAKHRRGRPRKGEAPRRQPNTNTPKRKTTGKNNKTTNK